LAIEIASNFIRSDHFLSLLPFAAGFFAADVLAAGLARGLAAAFAAGAFFAGAFFAAFGVSSSPSLGALTTGFSRFGRGPMLGLLSLGRISVIRSTVISSRYPRLRREF
jgi:hypothetical protein